MTEKQINAEALKPSKSWIQAGFAERASFGKLYFELIGCDGLPNMDSGVLQAATGGLQVATGGVLKTPVPPALVDKTDTYVCIIYEDSIVNTDCICDSLSPRWLPWTQRAFVFGILDPSSSVMLAVLDYDSGNPMDDDDPIGRVTVDLSNMRPMTDYTMQFDLTTSSLVTQRKTHGTVTVRVRIEWENERKALIKSATLPPEIYVNVAQHRDFLAAHYAIFGEVSNVSDVCGELSLPG